MGDLITMRWPRAFFALLFVIGQIASTAHAAEFGTGPQEHKIHHGHQDHDDHETDSFLCQVFLAEEDDTPFFPPEADVLFVAATTFNSPPVSGVAPIPGNGYGPWPPQPGPPALI